MIETIRAVFEDMFLYNNRSVVIPLFFAALIFLWIVEKNKSIRTVLVYLSAAAFVTFICPLYAWVGMKIDKDIYYRVLWALPMGILVCYSAVCLIMRFETAIEKMLMFIITLIVIAVNGRLVYTNTLHFRASNEYHIPPQIIDIADALKLDNYRPIAVMPAELLPFFRQYSADIFTPYGRNMLEPQWSFYNELYDVMEGNPEEYDAAEVARCARDEHCTYVVLSSAKKLKGSMEEQNYFLLSFVQGYFIYMDYNYYEVLKEQNLLDADVIERESAVIR